MICFYTFVLKYESIKNISVRESMYSAYFSLFKRNKYFTKININYNEKINYYPSLFLRENAVSARYRVKILLWGRMGFII